MAYPENDDEFHEFVIEKVRQESDESWIVSADGWWIGCGKDFKHVPAVGQTLRQYGKGVFAVVRGLFIDGHCAWYRTDAQQKDHSEIELYGADAADWLRRWDADGHVFSISMGGLGPGYEQCIQITTAEILRHFLAEKYDHSLWQDKDLWKPDREATGRAVMAVPCIEALGLSGAQWGAAMNLATMLYMKGPRAVFTDERVKDRHIQVMRKFPQAT